MNEKCVTPCTNCITFVICKCQIKKIFLNRGWRNDKNITYWHCSFRELTKKCSLIEKYMIEINREYKNKNYTLRKTVIYEMKKIFGEILNE